MCYISLITYCGCELELKLADSRGGLVWSMWANTNDCLCLLLCESRVTDVFDTYRLSQRHTYVFTWYSLMANAVYVMASFSCYPMIHIPQENCHSLKTSPQFFNETGFSVTFTSPLPYTLAYFTEELSMNDGHQRGTDTFAQSMIAIHIRRWDAL